MLTTSAGGAGRKAPLKLSKLGAVKKEGNFDEMTAQAKQEHGLAQFSKLSPMSPPTTQPKVALEAPSSGASTASTSSNQDFTTRAIPARQQQQKPSGLTPVPQEQQVAMERLGIGMRKVNLGPPTQPSVKSFTSSGAAQSTTKYSSNAMSETDKERKIVTGVKSMSSDQYFKQGSEEQDLNSERLRNIHGKTSVSSGQFFKNRAADEADDNDDEEFYEPAGASGILSKVQKFFEQELLGEDLDDDFGWGNDTEDEKETKEAHGASPYTRLSSRPKPDRHPR